MAKVLMPLANGFEELEAIAVIDVLRRGGVQVVTASIHDTLEVWSAHDVCQKADALFADVEDEPFDAIVLPGGGEGTGNLRNCAALIERLRRQHMEGRLLCAICAAPTVLDAAAVIDDEDVTCYPSCAPQMGRRIKDVPVVADNLVITGQGPGSATLFGLVVLMHLEGERVAHNVANGMLVEI